MHHAKDFECAFKSDLKFEVDFENKIETRKIEKEDRKKNILFQAQFLSPWPSFKPRP